MPCRIIIGIDPGSCFTGYGVLASDQRTQTCLAYGRIVLKDQTMPERLLRIYSELKHLMIQYQPQECAVEQVFFHRNAQSALKLGQARGAALVAAAEQSLKTTEYSAKQIKQAVVGAGNASKAQVQYMIRSLLQLQETPDVDAADALAAALCHWQTQRWSHKLSSLKNDVENVGMA